MHQTIAFLTAFIVVLIILISIAYFWYHQTGWKNFSYKSGDTVTFSSGLDKDGNPNSAEYIRFRNCIFTVDQHSKDVTATLNGMAVAYHGVYNPPISFSLGGKKYEKGSTVGIPRPLNAFSFTIFGFNDRQTIPTADDAKQLENANVTLVGQIRVI
jgi:hypothetical protein